MISYRYLQDWNKKNMHLYPDEPCRHLRLSTSLTGVRRCLVYQLYIRTAPEITKAAVMTDIVAMTTTGLMLFPGSGAASQYNTIQYLVTRHCSLVKLFVGVGRISMWLRGECRVK